MSFKTRYIIIYGLMLGLIQFLIFTPLLEGIAYILAPMPLALLLSVILYRKDIVSSQKTKMLNSVIFFLLGNFQIFFGIWLLIYISLYQFY